MKTFAVLGVVAVAALGLGACSKSAPENVTLENVSNEADVSAAGNFDEIAGNSEGLEAGNTANTL